MDKEAAVRAVRQSATGGENPGGIVSNIGRYNSLKTKDKSKRSMSISSSEAVVCVTQREDALLSGNVVVRRWAGGRRVCVGGGGRGHRVDIKGIRT